MTSLLNGHEFEQNAADSEGQESLVSYSPWGHKESDTTKQLIRIQHGMGTTAQDLAVSPIQVS